MKKQQVLKHIFSFAAASLACAAILTGNPVTPSPASGGIGQETGETGSRTGENTIAGMENPMGMGGGAENLPQSDDEKETEIINLR